MMLHAVTSFVILVRRAAQQPVGGHSLRAHHTCTPCMHAVDVRFG